jgi:hypothetical protein
VCAGGGEKCSTTLFDTWDAFNAPMPPEPRLYRQMFELRCHRGDVLVISGIKTWVTGTPSEDRETCARAESQ